MLTPIKLKELYEGKFDDLTAIECIQLAMSSLKFPLDDIKPRDPILSYVLESAKAVKLMNPTEKYELTREYRMAVIEGINNACMFDDYEEERCITPQLKDILRTKYDFLRINGYGSSTMDSTMMGCAPIVPYAGVIRKPRAGIPEAEDSQAKHCKRIVKACDISGKSKYQITKKIKDAIECYPYKFMSEIPTDLPMDATEAVFRLASDYTAGTESCELIVEVLQSETKMIPAPMLHAIESVYVKDGDLNADDMVELCGIGTESINLKALEMITMSNSDILTQITSKADMMSTGEEPVSTDYDVQFLLDYITQNTQYQVNDVANHKFLSATHINLSDIFDYSGFIFAEVDGSYLGTPVSDVSDGNMPKLVCIDKDDVITIIRL